ncbi:hypothetical protein GCM10022266_03120 [Agrococcus terreus]
MMLKDSPGRGARSREPYAHPRRETGKGIRVRVSASSTHGPSPSSPRRHADDRPLLAPQPARRLAAAERRRRCAAPVRSASDRPGAWDPNFVTHFTTIAGQ